MKKKLVLVVAFGCFLGWHIGAIAQTPVPAVAPLPPDAPKLTADQKVAALTDENKIRDFQIQIDQLNQTYQDLQSKQKEAQDDYAKLTTDMQKDWDKKKWVLCTLLIRRVFPGCTDDNDLQPVAVPQQQAPPAQDKK